MGRIPKRLMFSRFDHYVTSYTLDGGGQRPSYTLLNEQVPCNFQEVVGGVSSEYKQRDDGATSSIFLLDHVVYSSISLKDRIVFRGSNYRVTSKQNLINLDRVYRIDVIGEDN